MTPQEYRALAATYREAGEDANADVCEVMAQEAERLARYSPRDDPPPMDEEDTMTDIHNYKTYTCDECEKHHRIADLTWSDERAQWLCPTCIHDEEPAVVMTKDGPQALIPTFAPPPATIDDHTQQLTLL